MADTGLVLHHCPYAPSGLVAPSGVLREDAEYLIAEALRRGREGVATERDAQVAAAVDTAMARVRVNAPGVYGPILADFQRAALATSTAIMDAATRRAATALLQAEPWLSERVVAASRGAGAAGAESGLAAFAQKAWPYGIAALIVGVAAYGIATAGKR
jgi:hypothetical protein